MKRAAYIAIDPKTMAVVMACTTDKSQAESIAEMIANGMLIDRVSIEEARSMLFEGLPKNYDI